MPTTKTSPKRKKAVPAPPVEPVIEPEELAEEKSSVNEIGRLKRAYLYVLIAAATFAAGIFVGFMIWGYKPVPKPTIYEIETAGFPSLGPADAPIVIVEFSDYQCPYCWRWYSQVYQPLRKAYPGQIRFVYRNFPLSFHQNAMASAEAALCAGDQNAYWEFHNALFDNYLNLYQEDQGRFLDQTIYNQFAGGLGLDVAKFEACMTSHKYEQFIRDDVAYANNLPPDVTVGENGEAVPEAAVGGTPTFFINGHRLGGAYPFEAFQQIIEAELAKSK